MPPKQRKKRCDACYQRARNARCDGGQPCKYCADNDLECSYEEHHRLTGGEEGPERGNGQEREDRARAEAEAAERDREARRRADRELREREERERDDMFQALERERRELEDRARRLDRREQQLQAEFSERERALDRERMELVSRGRPRSPALQGEREEGARAHPRDHRNHNTYRTSDRHERSRSPYGDRHGTRPRSRSPDRHNFRRSYRSKSRERRGRSPGVGPRERTRSRSRSRYRHDRDYEWPRDRQQDARYYEDARIGHSRDYARDESHRGRAEYRSLSPRLRGSRPATSRERHQRNVRELEERLAVERRAAGIDRDTAKARAADSAGEQAVHVYNVAPYTRVPGRGPCEQSHV